MSAFFTYRTTVWFWYICLKILINTCMKSFWQNLHFTDPLFAELFLKVWQLWGTFLISQCKTYFKDTHKEKSPLNKIAMLTKSMSMDTWVVGTSKQLFIRGSYTEIKFLKKIKKLVGKLRSFCMENVDFHS